MPASTAEDWAAGLAARLAVRPPELLPLMESEAQLWERSGGMALTGGADGPPLPAPGVPGTWTERALAVVFESADAGIVRPGVELLGARAQLMGLRRRAPWSANGTFRALPTRDGWFGISLSRDSDIGLLPALVGADTAKDPWAMVADWLTTVGTDEAEERTAMLGLPAAGIPEEPVQRRPPVIAHLGGPRKRRRERPRVIDLSALWAGPLCAQLLGLTGAEVIKAESPRRPDAARIGSPEFFADLHRGHALLELDLPSEAPRLRELIRDADVVIESSRPRALMQMGIDPLQCAAEGVTWISITARGRDGDDAMRVGFGDDVAAGAGLVIRQAGEPAPVGDAIADPLSGVTGAAAATLALRGTRGSLLDVSMHDVCTAVRLGAGLAV